MTVLYLFAEEPNDLAVKIMSVQSRLHDVKAIYLREGDVSYEEVVDQIFEADKVISWNG